MVRPKKDAKQAPDTSAGDVTTSENITIEELFGNKKEVQTNEESTTQNTESQTNEGTQQADPDNQSENNEPTLEEQLKVERESKLRLEGEINAIKAMIQKNTTEQKVEQPPTMSEDDWKALEEKTGQNRNQLIAQHQLNRNQIINELNRVLPSALQDATKSTVFNRLNVRDKKIWDELDKSGKLDQMVGGLAPHQKTDKEAIRMGFFLLKGQYGDEILETISKNSRNGGDQTVNANKFAQNHLENSNDGAGNIKPAETGLSKEELLFARYGRMSPEDYKFYKGNAFVNDSISFETRKQTTANTTQVTKNAADLEMENVRRGGQF